MEEKSYAKQRLSEASHTKDAARRLTLFCSTAAVAITILLLVALIDYWVILSPVVRSGGLLLLVGVLSFGFFRFRATLREPTRLKDAALDVEKQSSVAGCELSTAAEYLSGERKPRQEYEQELASALEARASDYLRKASLPYWKRPLPSALLLGACALGVLVFGLFVSGGFLAFQRAATPWSNTPYSRVDVRPGNVEIPIGKDLDIKSIFSGRIPKSARFAWQAEGSAEWKLASLSRNEQGEFVYPLKNVRTPLSYRVSGSDAISPAFTIDPYLPPEVKDWRADLELPSYAHLPARSEKATNVSVLRASTAALQIMPNVKLARASLRFEDGKAVDLRATDNGFWKTELKIEKDVKFWVDLTDEKGHRGQSEFPYQFTALPDDPPKVEILDPGQDSRAEVTNSVPVRISVTDDYGLQEIKLVYHKLGGPEQFVTAKRNGETNSEFATEIPLSSLDLRDFELVAYHAEATDNNTLDGPGIGRSDVYFIEITNQEGGKCKSQGKSQRVNLLVIQKQIIADATALAARATPDKFDELAKRENDAVDFGNIYTQTLSAGGASAALSEMQSAVADMEKAQAALAKQSRADALPPAESALGHLYQVLKLMPELQDLPTRPPQSPQGRTNRPPMLNVVLDAMKKKKDQPDDQELTEALQQAEQLRDEQASVNLGVQSSGSGQGSGESKLVRASNEAQPQAGQGKPPAKSKAAKGKGKAGKSGQAGKGGKGKGDKPGDQPGTAGDKKEEQKDKEDSPQSEPPAAPEDALALAQKETELSKEASELAQKLQRLAGKNSRLGHNAGAGMTQAANQMRAAAQAVRAGNMQSAGTKGAESGASLEASIAAIQRALQGRPERVDVSQEESPREYETLIAEYLKKLSHEE